MIAIRAEQRRFALWSAAVLVVALPLWWLWGADLMLSVLRTPADIVLKTFGLEGGARATDQGWVIGTGLPLADGSGDLLYPVAQDTLRRFLLGVPLLLAFLSAPPRTRRPWRAAVIGLVAVSVVFLFSVTTFVWGELAPRLNPALAPAGAAPSVALLAAPLHPAVAQLALLGRYAGMSVLPLLTALAVWAGVNPGAVRGLFETPDA